jgi:hypothetical protein
MKTRIQSILIVIALIVLGLLPQVQAVSPAPDGCYPGFTTAEGCNALKFLSTGAENTKEIDPEGRGQFGLVAEDVEAVNPDLVVRDK